MHTESSNLYADAFSAVALYPHLSSGFRHALAALYYGFDSGPHLVLIVGVRGSGKTTLLRHFQERVRTHVRTAFVSCSGIDAPNIWCELSEQLTIDSKGRDAASIRARLEEELLRQGGRLLLILDSNGDADSGLIEVTEALTAVESFKRGLVYLVLGCSAGLAAKLKGAGVVTEQQCTVLAPLAPAEVESYIGHRLRMAGGGAEQVFAPDAYPYIAKYTQGVPARIDDICSRALAACAADSLKPIDASLLQSLTDQVNNTHPQLDAKDVNRAGSEKIRATSKQTAPGYFSRYVSAVSLGMLVCVLGAGIWYAAPRAREKTDVRVISRKPARERPVVSTLNVATLQQSDKKQARIVNRSELSSSENRSMPQVGPRSATTLPVMTTVPGSEKPWSPPPLVTAKIKPQPAPLSPTMPAIPATSQNNKPPSPSVQVTQSARPQPGSQSAGAEALHREMLQHQSADDVSRGDTYMELGKYDQAIQSFQHALSLSPGDPEIASKIDRALRARAAEQSTLR